jgi:hypothetical protein
MAPHRNTSAQTQIGCRSASVHARPNQNESTLHHIRWPYPTTVIGRLLERQGMAGLAGGLLLSVCGLRRCRALRVGLSGFIAASDPTMACSTGLHDVPAGRPSRRPHCLDCPNFQSYTRSKRGGSSRTLNSKNLGENLII